MIRGLKYMYRFDVYCLLLWRLASLKLRVGERQLLNIRVVLVEKCCVKGVLIYRIGVMIS